MPLRQRIRACRGAFIKKTRVFCGVFRKSLGSSQESSPTFVSGNYLPRGFSPRFFSNFPPLPYTPSEHGKMPVHRDTAYLEYHNVNRLSNDFKGYFPYFSIVLRFFLHFYKKSRRNSEKTSPPQTQLAASERPDFSVPICFRLCGGAKARLRARDLSRRREAN